MNTRDARRVKLNLPVTIQLLDDNHNAMTETEGKLHDLSRGGCAFYHRTNLPVGRRVRLRIKLNETIANKLKKKELNAYGAIIRSIPHAAGHLLSVRFATTKKNKA